MISIKTINDLDKLYDNGAQMMGGVYVCPVCNKQYKSKNGADKHIAKRDCYDLKHLFGGTATELKGYALYKELLPEAKVDIRTYRKSPYYNSTIRFHIFSNLNDLHDQKESYLTWLNEFKGCDKINTLMKAAIKESNLREFRLFLQKYPRFIDSDTFYSRFKGDLVKDGKFFIRSLEKAKVSLHYIVQRDDFPFEEVMENLDPEYQIRFEDLANKVLTEV